ncbi:hypothetical protein [Microvirga sp. 2TAF3]|uniref:hypothetical protein n=1 Tax=Microvirga sp. 2TAF3 TaxID=3233014 RepID=UPI003F96921E
MISYLVNTILFLALVTTSVIVVVMYRKLKTFGVYQDEYQVVLERTGTALQAAQDAVRTFNAESTATLKELGTKIEEAKLLLAAIDERESTIRGNLQSQAKA